MSYPPPPGLKKSQPKSGSSTPQPHPSLPARPPPPVSSLPPKPPHSNGSHSGSRSGGFSSFTGFKPRSVAPSNAGWQPPQPPYSPSVSAGPTQPPNYSNNQYNSQGYNQQSYYSQPAQAQQSYYAQPESYNQGAAPQIRNPFPAPGQADASRGGQSYDPELEAQIAQWQSAYVAKDDTSGSKGFNRNRAEGAASAGGANAIPLGARPSAGIPASNIDVAAAAPTSTGVAAVVAGPDGKQKTVVRSGGGQSWQDSSLLEWDPAHFRLFIGNLAGEVTDDSLLKAFSRYASVQKARVVRDKRTTKSKGYGFVSFSDGDDYFQAAKDMQGKYIGSHPVLIKRSTTDIKVSNPTDKKKQFKGKGGFDSGGRANTGAGVSKKLAKTKGGLKLLG